MRAGNAVAVDQMNASREHFVMCMRGPAGLWLSDEEAGARAVENLNRRLDELFASLPPAPSVPLSALDRGEIYR